MSEQQKFFERKTPLRILKAGAALLTAAALIHQVKQPAPMPEGPVISRTVDDGSISQEVKQLVDEGLINPENLHGRIDESQRRHVAETGSKTVQNGEAADIRIDNIPGSDESLTEPGIQYKGDTIDTDSKEPGLQPAAMSEADAKRVLEESARKKAAIDKETRALGNYPPTTQPAHPNIEEQYSPPPDNSPYTNNGDADASVHPGVMDQDPSKPGIQQ